MCPYLEITLLQVSNHDTIILSVWVPTMRSHNYSHNNVMGTDRLSQPLQRYRALIVLNDVQQISPL